ncbi:MAG TPA: MFS transporter [Syntrophorhabdales bacterium]|nr:MFS transporter [Syntrophorhabdales bacterium]
MKANWYNTPSESTSLLHNKSVALFWLARVSSTIAYQMLAVAVGWQIYALTRSPFYLGLVGLAQFLPMFLLTLLVGHVADRYDRRLILRICQVIEGVGVLALTMCNYAGWVNKETILAIVLVIGAARAFENPTLQALLPNLVTPELLPRAVALATSSGQTAVIMGPALGGFLYAAHPTVAYGTMGALFLGASLFISLIRIEKRPQKKRDPVSLQSLFAGIAFIRSKPAILGAISLDLFAVLLGGATALLPIYAREILVIGPWGLGILRSAPAAGALLMSVYLAHHPLKRRMGRTMFIAVIIFGIGTIVFGLSTSFVLSLIALAVLGAADIISVVIRQSLVQTKTPDAMRGRVSAVNSMFVGTSNQLGEFESGLTAAWFGVVPAVLLGGVGTIVVALAWIYLFPELARTDTLKQ